MADKLGGGKPLTCGSQEAEHQRSGQGQEDIFLRRWEGHLAWKEGEGRRRGSKRTKMQHACVPTPHNERIPHVSQMFII